jgi:hypothetical protein
MSMTKMSAEQAGAVLDNAYLRGLNTKLAARNYPPQTPEQLTKAAQTAFNLNQGIQTGQIKVSRDNDIFSAGLNATSALDVADDDVATANKAASYLLQDDAYLEAGLMAAQAELEAEGTPNT